MNSNEIFEKLQSVFDKVFVDEVKVTPDLAAKDVDEWDSLRHVSLILSIEEEFHIRFAVGDVEGTKNVGELAELIGRRLTGRS